MMWAKIKTNGTTNHQAPAFKDQNSSPKHKTKTAKKRNQTNTLLQRGSCISRRCSFSARAMDSASSGRGFKKRATSFSDSVPRGEVVQKAGQSCRVSAVDFAPSKDL